MLCADGDFGCDIDWHFYAETRIRFAASICAGKQSSETTSKVPDGLGPLAFTLYGVKSRRRFVAEMDSRLHRERSVQAESLLLPNR